MKIKSDLTSLPKSIFETNEYMGIFLIIRSYLLIALSIYLYYQIPTMLTYVIVVFFIGARQASLYELNHEASHLKLSSNKRLNYFYALIFCIIPFLYHPESYSFEQWKRIHILHHKYLMTENDPNYLSRVRNNENRLPIGGNDLFLKVIFSVPQNIYFFFFGKQDYAFPYPNKNQFIKNRDLHLLTLVKGYSEDKEMESERILKLVGMFLILSIIYYLNLSKQLFLFWLVPMYTSYTMVLKFMDLHDHVWHVQSSELEKTTRSNHFNLFQKIFISDLGRSHHLEHHLFPQVPCYKIEKLNMLIR